VVSPNNFSQPENGHSPRSENDCQEYPANLRIDIEKDDEWDKEKGNDRVLRNGSMKRSERGVALVEDIQLTNRTLLVEMAIQKLVGR